LYLRVRNSGSAGAKIFETVADYVQNDTWYNVRITRTTAGVFTVWIKSPTDTNFPTWTLIDTTGGSGTNPVTDNTYTTSNYIVIDADTGDKIANFKTYGGVLK